ncbi:uncharacterized protein CC84DRAFT_383019 [Paraphaeosphaeria sporulosa]|uniref:BTB domain-containing protein n=1 Tax=Paraphaeosphaeria sporulosa TaxID=1460663 RepID=A0A177BWB7_9PLEO|nr:uncharacterized protein CC84DRAFT_383019 [Paraphaeosphaeria sporulosa]OAF99783.1 hypothetical protein CC84DRAFT_383019 [Paraphaeosphaeria sporulosa]
MVKIIRYYSSTLEWTKLPQSKNEPVMSGRIHDVDMEGIEAAMEDKLVLRQGLRRKRSRADSSGFVDIEETAAKRVKVPELKRVQPEQFPAFTGTITIHVKNKGRKRKPLSLHIERDRVSSGFIARSVSNSFSDWIATVPKPIDLTHEDPLLVKHYVKWANTRTIGTRKKQRLVSLQEKSRPDYKESLTLDTEQLALCYGLGERLEDAAYRNALLFTMRYYLVKEEAFPSDRTVAIIYEQTKRRSPARKLMVDFWAYAGNISWLEGRDVEFSVCLDFFEDLFPALLRARAKPEKATWPWADNADAYLVAGGEAQTEEGIMFKEKSMEM